MLAPCIDEVLDGMIWHASYLASWSAACRWKRARNAFLADLVLLSDLRLRGAPRSTPRN